MEDFNVRGRFDAPHIRECIESLTPLLDERNKRKGAIAKLYLSDFKAFNDSFGYEFGGKLLNEITAFLESIDGIQVYHIRGVEYIIAIESHSKHFINSTMETILSRFEETWNIDNIYCICSVDAGIVFFPGDVDTPMAVLEKLSRAINRSANYGKNFLVVYNDELDKKYYRRYVIAQNIPKSIQNGEMEARFRPIYQVSAKRFTRVECSLRMYSEELGLVVESELIPVAEQSGQIYAISRFMISKACGVIASLIEQNKDFETVAVRLSPIQFQQEHFANKLADQINEYGIPANRLAIEIDETTAHSSFSHVTECIEILSDMGVEIILSDFGSSSLGLMDMTGMPLDVVKINKQLIWQIDNAPGGELMLDGLAYLAGRMGYKLIASGVETKTQASRLDACGCDYRLGLYYSRSLTAEELSSFIKPVENDIENA